MDEDYDIGELAPMQPPGLAMASEREVYPAVIACTLALRRSIEDAETHKNGIYRNHGLGYICPELAYSPNERTFTIMRRMEPIIGMPVGISGSYIFMPLSNLTGGPNNAAAWHVHRDVDDGRMWTPKHMDIVRFDEARHDPVLRKIAELYSSPPLHLYNDMAIREREQTDGTDNHALWSSIYTDGIQSPRRPNLYGTVMDSCSVDTRPFENTSTYEDQTSVSRRDINQQWRGFIDYGYTTANSEAGRIRCTVHGVLMRIVTRSCNIAKCKLLGILALAIVGNDGPLWTAYYEGVTWNTSQTSVDNAVGYWNTLRGHNVPSLHVHRASNIVVVLCTPGCMMRTPYETEVDTNLSAERTPFIDSAVFNSLSLRESLGLSTVLPVGAESYMRTMSWLSPYTLQDQSPRPSLGTTMAPQAIAYPYTSLYSTIFPVIAQVPVVCTPLMAATISGGSDFQRDMAPGVNLVVLFANFRGTYEDSAIISDEVNTLELFSTAGTVVHPVPSSDDILPPGTVLSTNTHSWWRPSDSGVAVSTGYTVTKKRFVVATMKSRSIRRGDKIATSHGQKQTISSVVPHSLMPLCTDVSTGKTFRPQLIIAATSVHNRVTPGQIYEARAGAQAIDVETRRKIDNAFPYVTEAGGSDYKRLPRTVCTFTHIGSDEAVTMTRSGEPRRCTADYGVCSIWYLAHLARDKQHFASAIPLGTEGKPNRLSGASVRIGEMEMGTMLAKGWVHTLASIIDSGDMANVTLCSVCRRLSLLCDCPLDLDPKPTVALLRASLVRTDICRSVASVARWRAYQSSLNEGGIAHAPPRPTSFVYGKP